MSTNFDRPPNFDLVARPYRWLEYLTFGPMLERCRFHFLPSLNHARRALVLGDGDGRFLARLLSANPALRADVVDFSPAMLRLLQARAARIGAQDRIALHCADARTFNPSEPSSEPYNLVATHFFLDCLTTQELRSLTTGISPHLAPGARWLISEFAIPSGAMSVPARSLVRSLYAAFGLLTGLRVRRLPDHAAALAAVGLSLSARHEQLRGVLISELWELPGNHSNPVQLP